MVLVSLNVYIDLCDIVSALRLSMILESWRTLIAEVAVFIPLVDCFDQMVKSPHYLFNGGSAQRPGKEG